MSNSYFGKNYNLGIDYGKLKDFQLDSSSNPFTPTVGNMAGQNNNNQQGNAFQRWWRSVVPPVGESNNPSVNQGILTESPQSKWLGDFINSGGVFTDKTGETTKIGDATNKDKTDKDKELEAEIAKEEREEGYWDRRVGKLEGIAQRNQRRQMIHGGLTGMGQSIMEGTLRGADSLDRAQAATATMISNMPKLQLTAMKYAQLQNYGLG